MTPLEYLQEQFSSVNRALGETLRQDYGPNISNDYHKECGDRLSNISSKISAIGSGSTQAVSVYLSELNYVSNWISLIERSQLGAFSWPFATALRRMAIALLSETDLKGDVVSPIVHVVADGSGYRINYEGVVPPSSAKKKFIVISFPRSLKHHVLLHTIFGHELGHAALFNTDSRQDLIKDVIGPLMSKGPLANPAELSNWMRDHAAPAEIHRQLAAHQSKTGSAFEFDANSHQSWLVELFCDLFGLVLFGPSFLGAHKAILQSMGSNIYSSNLDSATHPPYAVRQRLMVQAMVLLGWDKATIDPAETDYFQAEERMLSHVMEDKSSNWVELVATAELKTAITGLMALFARVGSISYAQAKSENLVRLISRIRRRLPPLNETIAADGTPSYEATHIAHCMYAGWIYWLSSQQLSSPPLDFLVTNRLCDQALLQQEAINRVFHPGLIS